MLHLMHYIKELSVCSDLREKNAMNFKLRQIQLEEIQKHE